MDAEGGGPELLARSRRDQVWRTLLPGVPLLLVVIGLSGADWDWASTTAVAVWSAVLLHRFFAWRRCGDLWDDGHHLQVRRDETVLRSIAWDELAQVHFWYRDLLAPQWCFAYHLPALPRLTVTRAGQAPSL